MKAIIITLPESTYWIPFQRGQQVARNHHAGNRHCHKGNNPYQEDTTEYDYWLMGYLSVIHKADIHYSNA